jgi:hypothetical protein
MSETRPQKKAGRFIAVVSALPKTQNEPIRTTVNKMTSKTLTLEVARDELADSIGLAGYAKSETAIEQAAKCIAWWARKCLEIEKAQGYADEMLFVNQWVTIACGSTPMLSHVRAWIAGSEDCVIQELGSRLYCTACQSDACGHALAVAARR